MLFTIGWTTTAADGEAIAALPAHAWDAYLDPDGDVRAATCPAAGSTSTAASPLDTHGPEHPPDDHGGQDKEVTKIRALAV